MALPESPHGFTYQLDANGHRGTAAIQRLVEYAPASGGLALWMQHRDVEQVPASVVFADTDNRQRRKPWVIGNDGSTLFYGPAFSQRPLEEQTGLVAHQVLHVALRHVEREYQLRVRFGDIDAELYAVCADAIVNSSLSHLSWLSLPKGSVLLDKLLLHVLGIDQPVDVSLHQWDVEALYRAIDDRQSHGGSSAQRGAKSQSSAASNESDNTNDSQTPTQSNDDNADKSSKPNARNDEPDNPDPGAESSGQSAVAAGKEQPDYKDGPKAHAARQLAATIIRDLIPAPSSTPETQTQQAMQWQERLLRAHAADADQSFMRQLLADNTTSRVPWEQLLRTRLQRALSLQSELNWSRPNRSWLANRGRTSSGNRLPWQPGTSYCRTAPRLCVMVDVSGSVNEALMQRFANEIDRIIRTFKTEAQLLVGDDCVRQSHRLKFGVAPLRSIVFDGGGATNFVPLIEAATRFKPDIGVFLTDLEGPAGDPPTWPIVWAVPVESTAQPVPFGQRILLD